MRGVYIPPSVSDYDSLFARKGGSLNDIHVYQSQQRGGSLLGLIGRIASMSLPFIKRYLLPEIPGFVSNVVGDVNSGKGFKHSFRSQGINSIKNVGRRVVHRGAGSKGCRRKKKGRLNLLNVKIFQVRKKKSIGKRK